MTAILKQEIEKLITVYDRTIFLTEIYMVIRLKTKTKNYKKLDPLIKNYGKELKGVKNNLVKVFKKNSLTNSQKKDLVKKLVERANSLAFLKQKIEQFFVGLKVR